MRFMITGLILSASEGFVGVYLEVASGIEKTVAWCANGVGGDGHRVYRSTGVDHRIMAVFTLHRDICSLLDCM
jgi:hypothetical protein